MEDVAFHYKGADGCFSVEELEEGYALAERKTGNAVPFESAEKAEIALRTLLEEAFRKQRLKLALKPSMHFFNKKFGKEIRSEARDDLRRALLNKYGKTEIEKRLSQWEWNGKRIELHGADITAFSIDDVYFIVESGTGVKSPKLHQAEDERALKEIADSIVQKQAEQMRKQALEVFGIGERTR